MPTEFTTSQAAVERSTYVVTVSFTDEDGNAVTPNAGLKWSLVQEDKRTAVNSRSDVALTPGTSVDIVLEGADLVVDAEKDYTWRYLVVEGTYDGAIGSNKPIKDHLKFPVQNIAKVPN